MSFTCPKCGRTSYHPEDERHRYCGACHEFMDEIVAQAIAFEREYARRSNVTVEWLREQGRVVATCDCGEDICEGFQSITPAMLASYRKVGRTWVQVVP